MCGIVGYIGKRKVIPVLIEGLRRLEYRGYDSAGLAFFLGNKLELIKTKGKLLNLEEKIFERDYSEAKAPGIGHTRWATHGEPTTENAHPHLDCEGKIALVHNGIIENYYELKERLIKKGHVFQSQTDTEVIAHLIEEHLKEKGDFFEAFLSALKELKGAYALAVIFLNEPEKLFVARNQSPLVLGVGEGENFIASDIPALLPFTNRVIFLNDGEAGFITTSEIKIFNEQGKEISKEVTEISWSLADAEKGGYPHFMLKEIFEQPDALQHTILGRIDLEKEEITFERDGLDRQFLEDIERIFIVACGTSYHAGLVTKYILERHARIPVEVDLASEFRYREPLVDKNSLFIAISQSGETADTLASLREAKARGAKILSICNVVGSTITRESDVVLYTQAGPEISVASTKAFSTQVCLLGLFSLYFAKIKRKNFDYKSILPKYFEFYKVLRKKMDEWYDKVKKIAEKWHKAENFLYLGRNILYPIALEGALKLKEISYIHAEGYAAGEMKHGPIALIDENFPTVVVASKELGIIYEKTLSNTEEIISRRGPVIAVVSEGSKEFQKFTKDIIEIPQSSFEILPIMFVIPLQLLAYEIARIRGCDIDKPRNLAKSVTVE